MIVKKVDKVADEIESYPYGRNLIGVLLQGWFEGDGCCWGWQESGGTNEYA